MRLFGCSFVGVLCVCVVVSLRRVVVLSCRRRCGVMCRCVLPSAPPSSLLPLPHKQHTPHSHTTHTTQGYLHEWSLRLNSTQHGKTHQVGTDRLIALSSCSVWWRKAVVYWWSDLSGLFRQRTRFVCCSARENGTGFVVFMYTDERPGQAAQPVVVVLVGGWLVVVVVGCFRDALVVNTLAWENMMGLVACSVGLCALGND